MFGFKNKKSTIEIMKCKKAKYDLQNAISTRQLTKTNRKLKKITSKVKKQGARNRQKIRGASFYSLAFLFLALPAFTHAYDDIKFSNVSGCTAPLSYFDIKETGQDLYGLWSYIDTDTEINYIEYRIKKIGNPTGNIRVEYWREDFATGDLDTLLDTSSTLNSTDITAEGDYRFTFDNTVLAGGDDHIFLIVSDNYENASNTFQIAYGCTNDVNELDGLNHWFPSGAYDTHYLDAPTTLGLEVEVPCSEHGTLGMFCTPIQNTATAFVGLFSTAILFTILNLWPYLLGIIIILVAYRAGRRMIRL